MGNLNYFKILDNDYLERVNLLKKLVISLKLFYYYFQRPLADFILKKHYLRRYIGEDRVFQQIDKFLWEQGGMFKEYVYKICSKLFPLKNSAILVPGIGYGRNLFQLASFKPKIIVAFDLYDYKDEWAFLTKKIFEKFGVRVIFFRGNISDLPHEYINYFDFIISDAVLEHIKDLQGFVNLSKKFLKSGGIFYASFGPIWYGPGGDHIDWGKDKLFNHLLLSRDDYAALLSKRSVTDQTDSCDGIYMAKTNLFSYLKVEEYFKIMTEAGFEMLFAWGAISFQSLSLLKRKPEMFKALNKKKVPIFDRFCKGIYLWLRLQK